MVPPGSDARLCELLLRQRESEEAIEENETVGIVVEPTTAEESSTDTRCNRK